MRRRSFPLTALLVFALLLPALTLCGCGWDEDDDGNVLVDNLTDTGPAPEAAFSFALARFGDPYTGNLLPGPLPAGSAINLGEWHEDYYDARADMEFGDLIEWFDVWLYADEDNYFDIY